MEDRIHIKEMEEKIQFYLNIFLNKTETAHHINRNIFHSKG